ncbi:MAG: hypothetical protein UT63_C0012G0007 [Candidatus Gottesmanbacteria bacterium GW2011_GWC2_39_8]|uniref:DUF304 domain-containing protein n=1 Tax=Candidatus Gottesmanbacteria bacterium GW2011_GWC2_39_8 TaxID=1618450 RepID=A0A0G0Q0P1_9BACT|nr:MAG: hypothetical protein UT63_C0012G0007 [Candidatus Gottesmanbacteria bacterium GW2011_GWC2_39_8]
MSTPMSMPTITNFQKKSAPFSSFQFMPEKIRFETQEAGEQIILLLRKHWITTLPWIASGLILFITPPIIFPIIGLSGMLPGFIPSGYLSFIFAGWYLLSFGFVLVNFILWYFSVDIVTEERIIDISFSNILYKKLSETRIRKLEDVSMRTGGFIRSVLDFGDVHLQTAGNEENFEFLAVPHPREIVRIVNELMGKEEEEGEK